MDKIVSLLAVTPRLCYTPPMGTMEIILLLVVVVLAVAFAVYFTKTQNNRKSDTEIDKEKLEVLLDYVQTDRVEREKEAELKNLARNEKREKLETYRRTKDTLRDRLRARFDQKEWRPIGTVLNNIDKGTVGTYVLYNATKNKYYVGQAKESFKRIREHFRVEQIALDHMAGDEIRVKILNATDAGELYTEYRMDHLEKTAIELFDANTNGYNKTSGNI